LVIVGGGPPIEEIHRRTLDLAGGLAAHILIIPFASPDPEAGEKSAALWLAMGATNVGVLDLADPIGALASIKAADLIWFRGGEQQRLMDALEGVQGVIDAIRERYDQGATIGGTSAGAAVMSRQMIVGPAGRRGTPEASLARFGNGLGLWPEVIVDQHFARRRRHVRLETAVHDFPELLGIGIDEATAIIVCGREFEVIGHGPVIVYDARKPEASGPTGGVAVGIAAAVNTGVASCTLRSGMRYHLDQGIQTEIAAAP
jgi:cyanophycinase